MGDKSVKLEVRVWLNEKTRNIHLGGKGLTVSKVSNDPDSRRYHPNLYRKLTKVLQDGGAPAPAVGGKLMPKGPKAEQRPADVIGAAVKAMRIATGEEEDAPPPDNGKSLAAPTRRGSRKRPETMQAPTADWLLEQIEIRATGSAGWGEPIPERGPGVYIVTIADPTSVEVSRLPVAEQSFWLDCQTVIYIGRTKHLSKRLRQFRKHVYGASSPHSGGQAVLKVDCPKRIYWAATTEHVAAEQVLLNTFREHIGVWPFGNRMRASRMRSISN